MRAGELRHRVTIEAPTGAQDEYGEPVPGWGSFATVWASREDLQGREYFAAQQVNASVTTRFRIRSITGIHPKMRLNSDGVLYQLVSVTDPDGRGRELVLMAERQG